jgi:heterotetrameric sarcosine oxidase gamma subunit
MNQPANNPARQPAAGDHALQQAGLRNTVHQAEDFQLALLTGIILLRLHTLQPWEELQAGLHSTGMDLPTRVNASHGQDPSALCLAPSEWLIFSEYLNSSQLLPSLQAAIDPQRSALLDQTAAFAVFRLGGPVAPWLLGKISPLDWHRGIAGGQHCCRTLLDRIPAIVHYHPPGSASGPYVFDVMMDRSLARHGWDLFLRKLPHARELLQQHGAI